MTPHEWDMAPMHAFPTQALPNFYGYRVYKCKINLLIK